MRCAGTAHHEKPVGNTGYVALFDIVDGRTIIIGAIRHQREVDYH